MFLGQNGLVSYKRCDSECLNSRIIKNRRSIQFDTAGISSYFNFSSLTHHKLSD
jgi:hypothetical protein